MEDARRAGLENKFIWKQYPRNLLFARALTNGARWYCAEIFGGAVYTREELESIEDAPADPSPKLKTKKVDPLKYTVAKDKPITLTDEQWSALKALPTDRLLAAKEERGHKLCEADQKKLDELLDARIESELSASMAGEPSEQPSAAPQEENLEAA